MIIKAACTACTKSMIVEDYEVGQPVNCPYCGNDFTPPAPKNRPAPTAPPRPGPARPGMPIVSAKPAAPPVQARTPAAPPVQTRPAAAPPVQARPVAAPPVQARSGPPPVQTRSAQPPVQARSSQPPVQARPAAAPPVQARQPGASGRQPAPVPVVEAQPVGPPPSSARATRTATAPVPVVEAQVVEEEADSAVRPTKAGKKKRRGREAGLEAVPGFLFGASVVLLLVLAFSPYMTWISGSVKATNKKNSDYTVTDYTLTGAGDASVSRERFANNSRFGATAKQPAAKDGMRTEAVLLMTMTIVVILLGCVALLCQIYGPTLQQWPDQLFDAGVALLAAWSLAGVLWMIGDIMKVSSVRDDLQALLRDNMRAQFELGAPGQVSPVSEEVREAKLSTGMGLWLGLLAALSAAAMFSVLGLIRQKMLWVGVGLGVGLLMGIVLMLGVVKPGDKEGGFIGTGPAMVAPPKDY